MPYTSEQNRVAERRNRTLMNMMKSMMSTCNSSESLWDEALKTVVYVMNNVPNKSISKTLFELWASRKPSLNQFCV